jgi:hypothetical protein
VTVTRTVYAPALAYRWVIEGDDEGVANTPSPKAHEYDTIVAPPTATDPLASNAIVCVVASRTLEVKLATGAPVPTGNVAVFVPCCPMSSVTVSVTV